MNIDQQKITYKTHPKEYRSAHNWVYKNSGKALYCYFDKSHKSKRFEWANLSGLYLHDMSDWLSLCVSCHKKLDFTEETRLNLRNSHLGKRGRIRSVKRFNLQGILIREYKAIADASRELGILRTSIANCLAGKAKSAGGYIWQT